MLFFRFKRKCIYIIPSFGSNMRDKAPEGYGTTTVFCLKCEQTSKMYGWLPTARQIWYLNEGLECCNQQTEIIEQIEKEE